MVSLRPLVLFIAGFVTWSLVLLRNHMQAKNRALALTCLIFCDDFIGIATGVWLARSGGLSDIVAVAFGGSAAAFVLMRHFSRVAKCNRQNQQSR